MQSWQVSSMVVVSLILQTGMVWAEDKALARQYFESGVKLQLEEDFEAAAAEFERSIANYEGKSALFNLANCYRALGRLHEALALFERVIKEFGDSIDKQMRKDTVRQIEEIKAEGSFLLVTTSPEGAVVKIDGQELEKTPWSEPKLLTAGERKIEVFIENYENVSRMVTLVSGKEETLNLTLVERQVSPLIQTKTDVMDAEKEEPLQHSVTEPPAETMALSKTDDKRYWKSPLVLAGLAGTVAIGGVAVAMWAVTLKKRNDREETIADMSDLIVQKEMTPETHETMSGKADEQEESIKRFNWAAAITTVATGACALLMTTGILVNKREDKEKSPVAVTPVLGGVKLLF